MANHSSASMREPHVSRTSRTNTIMNALKQRALAVLNDETIDPQSRAIIRYAMETHDPWLTRLVRRAETGKQVIHDLQNIEGEEDEAIDEKIAALADTICRDGDEPATKSAALVVLMATVEKAAQPKALANTVKHIAFTRCEELNFCGVVDTQIAVFESELFRD